jgi:hypothetical protein
MSDLIAGGRGKQKRQKAAKKTIFLPLMHFSPSLFPILVLPFLLFVVNRGEFDDLEETRAIGRLYLDFITLFFIEQTLADRR